MLFLASSYSQVAFHSETNSERGYIYTHIYGNFSDLYRLPHFHKIGKVKEKQKLFFF